jgi:hypothetical protein
MGISKHSKQTAAMEECEDDLRILGGEEKEMENRSLVRCNASIAKTRD